MFNILLTFFFVTVIYFILGIEYLLKKKFLYLSHNIVLF